MKSFIKFGMGILLVSSVFYFVTLLWMQVSGVSILVVEL